MTKGITDAQKNHTGRFDAELKNFYKDWVGPGQRDVIGLWLEHKMMKPLQVSPIKHSHQCIDEMCKAHNVLDGMRPKMTEENKKQIFVATLPAKCRTEYAKSARNIYNNLYAEIVQYMLVLYELEKQGRFRNSSE